MDKEFLKEISEQIPYLKTIVAKKRSEYDAIRSDANQLSHIESLLKKFEHMLQAELSAKGGLIEDVEKLARDKASMEQSMKTLPAKMSELNKEVTRLTEAIADKERVLAELETKVEAARVYIAEGEEMHQYLSSKLASH